MPFSNTRLPFFSDFDYTKISLFQVIEGRCAITAAGYGHPGSMAIFILGIKGAT